VSADLWDHAAYVRHTQDLTTDPHEAEGYWLDALAMVGGHLQRFLAEDTYTHRLRVWPRGLVYPHAIPVTSVSASAIYAVHDTCTLENVWSDDQPLFFGSSLSLAGDFGRWLTYQHDATWATVTYVGGYTSATMPMGLRRSVNQLTKALIDGPAAGAGRSVSSARVGDVAVTYATDVPSVEELNELVPGITRALRRYRLPSFA
jgi:hypothetical protein